MHTVDKEQVTTRTTYYSFNATHAYIHIAQIIVCMHPDLITMAYKPMGLHQLSEKCTLPCTWIIVYQLDKHNIYVPLHTFKWDHTLSNVSFTLTARSHTRDSYTMCSYV